MLHNKKIAIIGLGYVGLPLAVEFGKKFQVIGFDINTDRITQLKKGNDLTLEVDSDEMAEATGLEFSSDSSYLSTCSVFIVTVPTPIDEVKRPDLAPLLSASKTVGAILKPGDTVVYESTVYPGCIREFCVPILEQVSGLRFNQDFFIGYHPEVILAGRRINDGMGEYIATRPVKLMMNNGLPVSGSKILVLDLSFEENCPDLRDTRVVDVIKELAGYNTERDVFDPWVKASEAHKEYGISILEKAPKKNHYDAVVVAVGHEEFVAMGPDNIHSFAKPSAPLFDIKGIFAKNESDGRL